MTGEGHPIAISPQELFSILARIAWDIHVRLHFATVIRWIRKPNVHLFGWEVQVQVALAAGSRSLVTGAGTKGAGHYIQTSGTPNVREQAKGLVFGQGAGVGEVARISFVLLLSEPRETKGDTA